MARSFARPTDAPSLVQRAPSPATGLIGTRAAAERPPTQHAPAGRATAAGAASPNGATRDPLDDRRTGRSEAALEPFPVAPEELPRHVAIIMDGNRRWARQHGRHELEGHAAGVEGIRELLRHVVRRGVPVLSLYAFSRENWARSDEEVAALFGLLEQVVRSETDELRAEGVRVSLLGRLDELPQQTRDSIGRALDATAAGTRLQLNVAFNYSGRTELVDAARRLVAAGLRPDEIDEAAISNALYTAGQPDPDLIIRTGGDERLSNFLIWQGAYAEFYSSPVLWPDFGPAAFDAALLEFASRQRRFGR